MRVEARFTSELGVHRVARLLQIRHSRTASPSAFSEPREPSSMPQQRPFARTRTHRKPPSQDEIPTVRPPVSDRPTLSVPRSPLPLLPPSNALWQLVCDVMRAEADEALWGARR